MTNFHEGIFFLEKSILFEKYALGNKRLGWFSEIITQTGIYHFCPIFESKIFCQDFTLLFQRKKCLNL